MGFEDHSEEFPIVMPQTQAEPPQAEQPRTQQIETYKTGFDFPPFIYSDILGNVTFNT